LRLSSAFNGQSRTNRGFVRGGKGSSRHRAVSSTHSLEALGFATPSGNHRPYPELVDLDIRMTTTLWERRTAKTIDRRIGPLEYRHLRRQLRKASFRRRHGLPSRNLPLELVVDRLKLKLTRRLAVQADPDVAARLQWRVLRERLLERGRARRAAARRRARRSVLDTRINVWRRRQDWFRSVQRVSPTAGLGSSKGVRDDYDM
jgi:hypothetical protein